MQLHISTLDYYVLEVKYRLFTHEYVNAFVSYKNICLQLRYWELYSLYAESSSLSTITTTFSFTN